MHVCIAIGRIRGPNVPAKPRVVNRRSLTGIQATLRDRCRTRNVKADRGAVFRLGSTLKTGWRASGRVGELECDRCGFDLRSMGVALIGLGL